MCPSIAVLAGGGDGGGGSGGSAGDGSGDNNAGAGKDGQNAGGDSRGAPDYKKYPECGYASHPIDVVTGRAFTHPIVDLELPGPLPLVWSRMYSAKAAALDMGMGHGWAHTFGWKVEVRRRGIVVWNEQGVAVDFPMIPPGAEVLGPWGWVLRRETWGYAVDADDGVWHLFSEPDPKSPGFFLLTAVEDRNRNRIALTYDDGRLVEVRDSAGRIIRVGQTREGRIASIQVQNALAQGQWVAFATFTYDDRGDLASAMDADGFAAHYEYDEDHRLTLDQDRAGLAFHFVYDDAGRCVESWGDYPGKRDPSLAGDLPRYLYDGKTRAKGIHHCKVEYGPGGSSEVIDATEVRRYFGNRHGTLDKRVEGGGVITAQYDDRGNLLSRTDQRGATTSYTRDARGRLLSLTDALGRVTSIERDAAGLMTSFCTPAGGVRSVVRDRFGNATLETDELGATTSRRYDERGLLVEQAAPDGGVTRYEHDAHGNVISASYPGGAVYRFSYDALGRLLAVMDPLGGARRYAYSNRGDVVAKYDATGACTRFSWDGERQITMTVSPSGRVTELVWGGYRKLCGMRDACGHWVRLVYSSDGMPLEIINERGESHRYDHRPSGMMIEETSFDGVRTHYKYDAAGDLVETRDALGQKTVRVRDLMGEIVERHLPDGTVEKYEHDALGNVIRGVSGKVEVSFERDLKGRVIRETLAVGDEVHTVEHVHEVGSHAFARRTSLGHVDERRFDPESHVEAVILGGQVEVRRELDLLGRERARHLPRGGRIESEFDALGNLVRRGVFADTRGRLRRPEEPQWIGARRDGTTFQRSYRYDVEGEIVESVDDRGRALRFEHDPLGQLLAVVPADARGEIFRFDPTGSLREEGPEGPIPTEYGPGGRLLRRGAALYRWNDVGQLVEKSVRGEDGAERVWRYAWTGGGLLASVATPDGGLVELQYDAFDRRVGKRVSRPSPSQVRPAQVSFTRFVWDGDEIVHEIKRISAGAGDPVVEERTYCFEGGDFAPLAHREVRRRGDVTEADEWVHYVNDPAGTPDRLVGADGAVLCEIQRSAWGRVDPTPGARARTSIRFQGQMEDEETGLHYNRFRYYDPEVGRYISADPISVLGGLDLFRYVADPFASVDPYGLARCTCTIKLKEPVGGKKSFDGKSGDMNTPHHKAVQGALDSVNEDDIKKKPKHEKGNCAEPRALTNYLNAWEKENGTINNRAQLLDALKNVDSIDPQDNELGKRKKMCAWCQAMMKKLGGSAAGMTDKVKKKGAVD